MQNKNIILIIVLVLIGGSVWYLESGKVKPSDTPTGDSIALTEQSVNEAPQQTVTATSSATSAVAPVKAPADLKMILAAKVSKYKPAKELVPGGAFINSDPFALKDIIGKKVVLLDIWTYSCINCQRTIPYLNAWYKKYKDQGLEIVGIHSPEFDFEKDADNVRKAVKDFGIEYPVMQDNNLATWRTYQNNYWPREYLVDIDGYIVHDKIGEGSYDETEHTIQKALQERADRLGTGQKIFTGVTNPADSISYSPDMVNSPETYFGATRNEFLANGTVRKLGAQTLAFPTSFEKNKLYLDGTWNFENEFAQTQTANSKITFNFNSKNVYFVASSESGVKITVMEDGKVVGADKGKDVASDGTVLIKENKLYNLIEAKDYGEHTIEIIIEKPNLKAFTFTFG